MDRMARLGNNAQLLSRCGSTWTSMATGAAPVRITTPLCHGIRQASTTKTARSTKKLAKKENTARPDSAATTKPKKAVISPEAAAAAPDQRPEPATAEVTSQPARPAATKTRATEFKSSPATPLTTATAASTTTIDGAKPRIDPSGPEYKSAARKWVSTMIALPVLIVTSYFLFDRLVSGHNPSLGPSRPKPQPVAAAEDA